MFTPIVRLVLAILSACMAFYHYTKSEYLQMVFILIAGALFLYGYFKAGTVYIAFKALQKQEFEKAEKLISKIKNPENLAKSQKNYYHFVQGFLASNKNEWNKSYLELNKALEIGLRTENDTSIALSHLAEIELQRKNYKEATAFINRVRELKLIPIVASETDRIEKEIEIAQQESISKN